MELVAQHLTRQADLIPLSVLGEPITIIGAGAIGGWTALSLAKMGFGNITVFDFDKVDVENMNSQFYRFQDIGRPKVRALQDLVESFTGIRIAGVDDKYPGMKAFPGIVIAAVDSMEARKSIWDAHKIAPFTKLVIDPRMGAETALMYVREPLNKPDAVSYEKTLYTDANAVQERCTAKATIYTANLLAGMVVKTVKDFLVTGQYVRNLTWDISKDAFQAWRTDKT